MHSTILMSLYSGQTEYHLTPRGWVRGTESYFDRMTKALAPPPDRVETWVRTVTQDPNWIGFEVDWQQVWTSHDIGFEKRRALNRTFPHPRFTSQRK